MKILASVFQLWPVYKVNWPSSDREELNWNGGRLLKKPNGWDGKELNFLLLRKKILLSNSQIGITTFYNKVLQRSLISLPLLCARQTFLEASLLEPSFLGVTLILTFKTVNFTKFLRRSPFKINTASPYSVFFYHLYSHHHYYRCYFYFDYH